MSRLPLGSDPGPAIEFSPQELRRYSRHLLMPEVDREGQARLRQAKVLVIGLGGLGSPVSMYLAAAGVGRLGLVEFDEVDESNLQRQILYGQADIGKKKLDVALTRLREINPLIELEGYPIRLESANALELIEEYDLVVDGSDNFPTRYLVNDACVLKDRPNVFASIFRFEGQVSVFWGREGPCYRCLFPQPPPPGEVPSCAEGGVLGVLPGIVGSLQANEAIKLILGRGEPLIGRLVVLNALTLELRSLRLSKNPDCPVCSKNPSQVGLVDYDTFCGVTRPQDLGVDEINLEPKTVAEWRQAGREFVLLDVRTPREWQICRLEDARLVPLSELPRRLDELDRGSEIVVYCHHGTRSLYAVKLLRQEGFERARNLAGGIDAWSRTVDPDIPLY
ncbi:MAG: molybdopterin-synthase adenylyltransferase MoeB [Acidobacteriota bacterium]|jgi:molybdopterin/thiamine biosynthesis adenylyltransferase/rhodanese-related sulfurtransferase